NQPMPPRTETKRRKRNQRHSRERVRGRAKKRRKTLPMMTWPGREDRIPGSGSRPTLSFSERKTSTGRMWTGISHWVTFRNSLLSLASSSNSKFSVFSGGSNVRT
ncbi:hypothetical protein PENTCL1PPCAC_24553, partial [Pristionchus entomophagus]